MKDCFYTVYQVTNKVSGKIYIGVHKTTDLDDGYMGSGKYLTYSYKKHGMENFTKEILFVFDNPDDMYAKEAELVNEEFIAEKNTYNLKSGGFGGFDYINSTGKNLYGNNGKTPNVKDNFKRGREKHARWRRENPEWWDGIRHKISETLKGREGTFTGRSHSEETKKVIGKKSSIHQSGKGNSQYGTRWIHSLTEKRSKKIKKESPLPEGWVEGRKTKF